MVTFPCSSPSLNSTYFLVTWGFPFWSSRKKFEALVTQLYHVLPTMMPTSGQLMGKLEWEVKPGELTAPSRDGLPDLRGRFFPQFWLLWAPAYFHFWHHHCNCLWHWFGAPSNSSLLPHSTATVYFSESSDSCFGHSHQVWELHLEGDTK